MHKHESGYSEEINTENKGLVFNIQKCSLHDGSGIRTLVFMKGCHLHCLWCANPESQKGSPEILFDENKCIGDKECGWCKELCTVRAIKVLEENIIKIDRSLCTACGKCAEVCPSKAINLVGKLMSINEIL